MGRIRRERKYGNTKTGVPPPAHQTAGSWLGVSPQHSPSTSTHVGEVDLVKVGRLRQGLRQHVGAVVLRRAVFNVDVAGFDALASKVMANVDVL